MRLKESFSQQAHEGIPWHVVVSYWDDDGSLMAAYFDNWADADIFVKEILTGGKIDE